MELSTPSATAGSDHDAAHGPTLLHDLQLVQKLLRFDRERIPERVVHAGGTGAHGIFTATDDLADVTCAKLFAKGTVTPAFVRFSTVVPGRSGSEATREPRGFATKFYTQDGNWDLVGNNLPVFFIRDPLKFPEMVHALKPDPVTNLPNADRTFGFLARTPETTHLLLRVYSNFGTPANYRQMDASSVQALVLVNARGDAVYAKFAWRSRQGERNLRPADVAAVQGRSTSHATQDLYEAIGAGKFPKWDLTVQILRPIDAARFDFDPLDPTKIWPDVAERKIGTLVLNRVPDNFFQATEQVAMSPGHLVPGIEASPDRLLQARLFAYADSQAHRLGASFRALPINRPLVAGGERGGSMPRARHVHVPRPAASDDFRQAGEFYRGLSARDKKDLTGSLAADLGRVTDPRTVRTMLSYFWKADADFGKRVAKAVGVDSAEVAELAAALRE